jgi:hypothetical protein
MANDPTPQQIGDDPCQAIAATDTLARCIASQQRACIPVWGLTVLLTRTPRRANVPSAFGVHHLHSGLSSARIRLHSMRTHGRLPLKL